MSIVGYRRSHCRFETFTPKLTCSPFQGRKRMIYGVCEDIWGCVSFRAHGVAFILRESHHLGLARNGYIWGHCEEAIRTYIA